MTDYGRLIRGILLVSGTSIGGGMLALPVLTGPAGFVPSLFIYFICWLFMACTGLLFLEISMWMNREANIVSMAQYTLGKGGKVAAWILYLFLFYSLTLAYIVGSGDLIADIFKGLLNISDRQGQLLFLLVFAPIVYVGARLISRVNLILMVGLGASYLMFVVLGAPHVDNALLKHADWSKLYAALPITFTAFAYQGIVPSLVDYMNRDVRQLRLTIIIGSFLPLITYAIWQWLILGIVPVDGPGGLVQTLQEGQNAVHPLKNILDIPQVYIVGQYFAFFALVTSFLGVTLGLMDFLADGMQVEKTSRNKIFLCALVLLPPLFVALIYPNLFLIALNYAGGYGCALLLGLMPILMVWQGRYRMGLQGEYRLKGGKILLGMLLLFVILELGSEFAKLA